MEKTHKCKNYFYQLGPKQVQFFTSYREYLKISLHWEWKYMCLIPLWEYRGPGRVRSLDNMKKTCYIIFSNHLSSDLYLGLYTRIGFLLHLLRLLRFYWNLAKCESQVTPFTPFLFKYLKKWNLSYSVYSVFIEI